MCACPGGARLSSPPAAGHSRSRPAAPAAAPPSPRRPASAPVRGAAVSGNRGAASCRRGPPSGLRTCRCASTASASSCCTCCRSAVLCSTTFSNILGQARGWFEGLPVCRRCSTLQRCAAGEDSWGVATGWAGRARGAAAGKRMAPLAAQHAAQRPQFSPPLPSPGPPAAHACGLRQLPSLLSGEGRPPAGAGPAFHAACLGRAFRCPAPRRLTSLSA